MGLLDQLSNLSPDQNQGLLAAAAALLQAGGPSRTPTSFGQALGAGLTGYQQGIDAAQQRRMQQEQAGQLAQLRTLDINDRQRAAQQEQMLQQAYGESGGDTAKLVEAVSRVDPIKGFQLRQQLAKSTEFDTTPQVGVDASGQPFTYILGKNGEQKRLEGTLPRDKLELANLGGRDMAYNPFALQPGQTFQRTQTPDSAASVAATLRGQNLTDARARELNQLTREGQQTQIINDPLRGPLLVDKGTGRTRQAVDESGKTVQGAEKIKNLQSAQKLVPVIEEASRLINSATGSYAGAGIDQAARVVGLSTPGAQSTAKLRVLESQLILNMPRLEGPQSDKDTMLYRQAAAQIGDPTVPAAQKQAALETLKDITYRNAGMQAPAKSGGWGIEKVN